MSSPACLQSRLAAALPLGLNLRTYHLSTPVSLTSALFVPSPGYDEETTSCESQFLAVSSPRHGHVKELFVYAIEVLIFTTKSLTTVFVSKADSTGFLSRLVQPKGSPSIAVIITSTFIEFLLEPRLTSSRVVLALFARSQKQYLFPGSSENSGKHVLDDRQLVKWWCRVFDKMLRSPRSGSTAVAHLLVPGCDKTETRAFFPSSSRADSSEEQKWIPSYPVELMVTDPSLPPRYIIPRLPDDPKARFLDDLDGDFVDERGNWRNVKDLGRFWEFMSYRQECSAGRLVGFLWLVFSGDQIDRAPATQPPQTNGRTEMHEPVSELNLTTPCNSQLVEIGITESVPPVAQAFELLRNPCSPPPSSPIQEEPEPDTSARTDPAEATTAQVAEVTFSSESVDATKGEIILDDGQYQALMDYLLETDFAGEELAAAAGRSWIDKVLEMSKAVTFGRPVLGFAAPILTRTDTAADTSSAKVNVLTGIRRKRKVDTVADGPTKHGVVEPVTAESVSTLSAGLVRKRPKS